MKKKIPFLALLSASLLVACYEQPADSSTVLPPSSEASSSQSSSSSSSTLPSVDNGLKLFMQGDLYPNQIRSIYASFLTEKTGTLVWTSSDESIVSVSSREDGAMPEALLTAQGEGEVTIRAALEEDSSIQASLKVKVSHGLKMEGSLYDAIKGAGVFKSTISYLSYDASCKESADSSEEVKTTFEENKAPSVEGEANYTDAVEMSLTSGGSTKSTRFVRTSGGKVGTEYITLLNEVSSKDSLFGDDEETMAFDASGLTNPFGHSEVSSAKDFESYDGGKTYHFIGGYQNAASIAYSLSGKNFTPDDIALTVKDGAIASFVLSVDPASSESGTPNTKYGMRMEGTLSELGTAKITHLSPFAHEAKHDALTSAIKEIRSAKNYSFSYDLTFKGGETKTYTYRLTEDTVDAKVTSKDGTLSSHTGLHKTGDKSYIRYEWDSEKNKLVQTQSYKDVWEGINNSGIYVSRYPTFSFASEITLPQEDGSYLARDGYTGFIPYVAYLPATLSLDTEYLSAKITLKDGHIGTIDSKFSYDGTTGNTLHLEYGSFGSTSVSDLDFENMEVPSVPTSWEEESESLYKSLLAKKVPLENLPYLHPENGWSADAFYLGSVGTHAIYMETKNFDTEASRDQFVLDYRALLLSNGFTRLEEIDKNNDGTSLYQKGTTKISVAVSKNQANGVAQDRVKLWIYDDAIEGSN